MLGPADGDTLGIARAWLRNRVEAGAACPCCRQFAKVYRRKVNSGMARSLIRMYRADPERGYVYIPDLGSRSREEGKLRYWGLVEEERTRREDGGRAGYWRVTDLGEAWVLDRITIPSHARVYDSRCLGLDDTQRVSIRDALGNHFNYDELMRGE
jgi:hypothetical protein